VKKRSYLFRAISVRLVLFLGSQTVKRRTAPPFASAGLIPNWSIFIWEKESSDHREQEDYQDYGQRPDNSVTLRRRNIIPLIHRQVSEESVELIQGVVLLQIIDFYLNNFRRI
jgi:hypothetical protein